MQNELLWSPNTSSSDTTMARYIEHVSQQFPDRHVTDYDSLHHWSVEHFEEFWKDWLVYSGVIFEGTESPVFTGSGLRGTRFFPEVRLNFAENLLRIAGNTTALAGISEARDDQELSLIHI